MSDTPSEITVRRKTRCLRLGYADGQHYELSWEYLRVYSPSAEVQGHSPDQAVLQTGKENVVLSRIEPIGHYAIRLVFDDGHDSGLYSWKYLRELAVNEQTKWADYLDRLRAAGYARSPRSENMQSDR